MSVANFSYSFDTIGNLTKRTDGVLGTAESFCYDTLNRLSASKLASSINCASDAYTMALSYSVNGTIDNPTYSYDSNGNMTGGAGRTYTWTSFNLVHSIVQASTTLTYTYDAEHARVKQVDPNGTTYYFTDPFTGDVEEKYASGTTTWREYIMAPGAGAGSAPGLVAERSSVNGATTSSFFIDDSLGSSSIVLDSSGAVVQRLAYDAWGLRTDGVLAAVTTRQFTGQEQIPIPGTGLLNYNARIYDPEIGRFLSADPTIPDPHSSQSLNRFSYVLNEPLSKTDPSGLDWYDDFYIPTGSNISEPRGGPFVSGMGYFAPQPITGNLPPAPNYHDELDPADGPPPGPVHTLANPSSDATNGQSSGGSDLPPPPPPPPTLVDAGPSCVDGPNLMCVTEPRTLSPDWTNALASMAWPGAENSENGIGPAARYISDSNQGCSADTDPYDCATLNAARRIAINKLRASAALLNQAADELQRGESVDKAYLNRFERQFDEDATPNNLRYAATVEIDAADALEGATLEDGPCTGDPPDTIACTIYPETVQVTEKYYLETDEEQASRIAHEGVHLATGTSEHEGIEGARDQECWVMGNTVCGYPLPP